jgi:CO dehydrogenase nickel-insertion accessory protein CooC1
MKIVIAGKGGAGKTTLAGLLARRLAENGYRVLAIDADPDASLASALPLDNGPPPKPLAQRRDRNDRDAVQAMLGDWPLLAHIPYCEAIRTADMAGRPPEIPASFQSELQTLSRALAASLTVPNL